MRQPKKIAVIVLTYNWEKALELVLNALNKQTDQLFEIIVADDGSTEKTKACVLKWQIQSNIPIHHIWQPDDGFRAAAARNAASIATKADYIVYLDGDCIPAKNFVAKHRILAQPGYFVTGNRILLSKNFTTQLLQSSDTFPVKMSQWLTYYFQKKINRILPIIPLPIPSFLRLLHPKSLRSAKSCNLGIWKKDLLAVNGWNERFKGWGYEDSDLLIRLIRHGVYRKSGRFATTVMHCWHPENDQSRKAYNHSLLMEQALETTAYISHGLKENWFNHQR